MNVTLVRHTKVAIEPGTCYGNTDVDVADSFLLEAAQVRSALSGKVFDVIYSSPLRRCQKLAVYCGYASPLLDDRLKELNFGDWEGQRWEAIQDPRLQEWYDDWLSTRAGGAESFLDQYNRVSGFLDQLKATGHDDACLFTHGGTIRSALIYVGKYNFNQAFSSDIGYGSQITIQL